MSALSRSEKHVENWKVMVFPEAQMRVPRNHSKKITALSYTTNPTYRSNPAKYAKILKKQVYRNVLLKNDTQWLSLRTGKESDIELMIKEINTKFKSMSSSPKDKDSKLAQKVFNSYLQTSGYTETIQYINNKENQPNNNNVTIKEEEKFYNDLAHDISNEMDENFNVISQSSSPMSPPAQTVTTYPHPKILQKIKKKKVSPSPARFKENKILFLIDFDDTLIPSHIISHKYKKEFNKSSITPKELKHFNLYIESITIFISELLRIFGYNKKRNLFIVTNGSTYWMREDSFDKTGDLMKNVTILRDLIQKYNIGVVGAIDLYYASKKDDPHKQPFGRYTNKPEQWKYSIFRTMINEYFGKNLKTKKRVKIISVGDSDNEYNGIHYAWYNYLSRQSTQSKNIMNGSSLHRVKFISKPTIKQLYQQIDWMTQNIQYIICRNMKTTDYVLKDEIDGLVPL